MKNKFFLFTLSVLLILFISTGCTKIERKGPIKISINLWSGYAYAFIAQEKGIFSKNNVEVELIFKNLISESAKLFKDCGVDGFFDVFTDVVVINSEGIPTKVVYITDYSSSGDVIIGRPELNSISDLKGKRLCFEGVNSFSHLFVLRALKKAGIDETEVQFENLPAMEVLNALESGKIDAGHTWEPIKTQAIKKGYKVLITAGDIPGVIIDVLAFHEKIVEERPDDIQGIVKSLIEARDFIFSNRKEAIEIMARAEGMATEEMESGINGVHLLDLDENVEAMKVSSKETSLYRSFDAITDFYITSGQISQKQDVSKIIEPRFAENIKLLRTTPAENYNK
ncbi:MAG: ABC transporter substrate-binding protein [Planctomycetes bacterium]|uniref:ABC transporter substrate-binding protein n=1 Tax=Candidatus Wunengus sp. YC65 TaxID=3367701 RepID=UPI001DBDFC7F|nr:ABC transporter substrate-binding protein [Planctomycetota bacterium]